MTATPRPTFFPDAAAFRAWLETHHATASELRVGYYKKGAPKKGITYQDAVEEALCFGWIDGVTHRIDEHRYMQRFTPRRVGSNWSNVNVAHIARLTKLGKMHPAGLAAFAARRDGKTGIYAFERKTPAQLPPDFAQRFRANRKAWAFFSAQAPWYQRTAIHKVVSPKLPATRERWLARLIADSAAGRRLAALTPTSRSTR
jgi:uncharacterized protein YdeI (YjbR/CyaY-like superfamily)